MDLFKIFLLLFFFILIIQDALRDMPKMVCINFIYFRIFLIIFLVLIHLHFNFDLFNFFSFNYTATEIQNIQIADGDVCRGQSIPVHMIFPRLFTCPTLATKNFKVEFEVNIVVVFQDGHLVTENFPIKLVRDCI